MRTVRRNKQNMYYALLIGESPEYKLDKDGKKIVVYIDDEGIEHYRETGKTILEYSKPEPFKASISFSGSDITVSPFGINDSDYDATVVTEKGLIPITETSLVWFETEPTYKDEEKTIVEPKSADYTIVKITPSLDTTRYVLKKIVK